MINKIKEKILFLFKKGSFRRDVILMFSGTAISQGIYLLFYPILTRIYSPENFGQYAIFMTFLSICTVIVTGQYELAFLLTKKDENFKNLTIGTIVLSLFISILVTVILILGFPILQKYNLFNTRGIVYFLGGSILINGLYQTFLYVSLRKRAFKFIAIANICNVAFSILFQYIFSQLGFKENGLIVGYIIGTFIALGLFISKNREILLIKGKLQDVSSGIKDQMKKYRNFPIYNLPAILVNLIANQAPQVLLNTFGKVIVGYFSLSQKILGSPVTLFSTSVSQVFRERASRDYREKGNCKPIFVKTFKSLLLISVVPFLLIFISAPILVPFIFGSEWTEAGTYVRALTLMYFFKFSVSPLTYVIIIAEKQKINFLLQTLLLILTLLSIGLGIYLKNPLSAIIAYSIAYSVIYIIFFIVSFHLSGGIVKHSRE
jgi:O-antigen/teichoic acid export membrane protein